MSDASYNLIDELRRIRATDGKERIVLTHKLCDLFEIAMPAIYTAASAGNVTCRTAVQEMEKKLKQYESR